MNGKTRSTLLGCAGGYLVYLAYGLFRDRADTNTTMSMPMRILFMAIFALAGIGLVVYALILWKRSLDEEKQDQKNDKYDLK